MQSWSSFKGLIMVRRELQQQHPAPGRPESAAWWMSPPDNKSWGYCCRNSRPTVTNPDYDMTIQLCIKCICDKILSKCPPNRATSPTLLHCEVTHLSLMTGVVVLHMPSWRVRVHEKHRQVGKTMWPVYAWRVICHSQIHSHRFTNHHKHTWDWFLEV